MTFGMLISVLGCFILLGGHVARAQEVAGPKPLFDQPESASNWKKYQLGLRYAADGDKPRNDAVAARWMRLALQDTAPLLVETGWRHGTGPRLCQRDELYRFKAWADLTDTETEPAYVLQRSSAYALGREYGYPVKRDEAKGMAMLRKAAEAGNPTAQNWLFHSLLYEDENRANDAEAMGWAGRASDQGDYGATFRLGTVYEDGFHVKADAKEAVRLYKLAHKQERDNFECWKQRLDAGETSAALNIGFIYHSGVGVPPDRGEARKYFEIAADKGNPVAQLMMADTLLADYEQHPVSTRGERCRQAAPYYRVAADQGNTTAQTLLANLIRNRCITGTDAETFALYLSAAEDPFHSVAQFEVAIAYRDGQGVEKDRVQASKWFAIIAHIGSANGRMAAEEWQEIQKQLTPDEKGRAQKEARQWLSTHPFPKFAGAPFLKVE